MSIYTAPLRLSFTGVATDIPDRIGRYTGMSICAAIDKYVTVEITTNNHEPPGIYPACDLIESLRTHLVMREKITTKTPLRITFVGGGTDLPYFYREHGGACINATIDKYLTISLGNGVSPLDSSPYVRAVKAHLGIRSDVTVKVLSDIPPGMGLGGSNSLTVGLLKAFGDWSGRKYPKAGKQEVLAQDAFHVETEMLGMIAGKQDQYAAAYTGFNHFVFNPDDSVEVHPINESTIELQKHLLLIDTNKTHNSKSIHKHQKRDAQPQDLNDIKALVPEFLDAWKWKDYKQIGLLLDWSWALKRKLTDSISNSDIDAIYRDCLDHGVWGGKVLGAGGGGFIIVIAPPDTHAAIKSKYKTLDFHLA